MKYMGWIWPVVVLVVFVLTGCGPPEKILTMDEVLPAGYTEKVVPKEMYEPLSREISRGNGWVRCIDCDMDWEELKSHLSNVASANNYSVSTKEMKMFLEGSSGLPDEHLDQMLYSFSSASGNCHLVVMNIGYIRTLADVSLGTTGDYLILSGYDNTGFLE